MRLDSIPYGGLPDLVAIDTERMTDERDDSEDSEPIEDDRIPRLPRYMTLKNREVGS